MSMAGYKGDLRHLAILGVLLAVLLYAAAVTLAEDDKIPFVWQGTVTLAQTQLTSPRGTGAITDRWVLSVRWKETQRIEVKDAGGSLIGWFVKLEDDSSSWQGETTGGYEMECRRGGVETRVESGEASGVGDVFTPGWGWLYYSASDEDPLASILPNGAYAFCSTSTSTQKYTVNWIRHGCPTSDGRVDVTRSTRPAYLHYKVGGRYMFEPCSLHIFLGNGEFAGKRHSGVSPAVKPDGKDPEVRSSQIKGKKLARFVSFWFVDKGRDHLEGTFIARQPFSHFCVKIFDHHADIIY